MSFDVGKVTPDWTLFLDRDGVINIERPGSYTNSWEEFVFHEGVLEATRLLALKFRYIFVVTNQRGVGRGITPPAALEHIHQQMLEAIQAAGGRIDNIYYCTAVDQQHPCRKPNPGMGLQAKEDFQQVDLSRSVMVGNTFGDMKFGRNLGCRTIFLPTTLPGTDASDPRIDALYDSLYQFALALG